MLESARRVEEMRPDFVVASLQLERDAGWVEMPFALARKLPSGSRSIQWQWLFPATRTYFHEETERRRRHHLHETVIQRAVSEAADNKSAVSAAGTSSTKQPW